MRGANNGALATASTNGSAGALDLTRPAIAGRRPTARATISFCITTRGPAERARQLLEIVRPHVDEIVLAVQDPEGLPTLAACRDLADTTLVYALEGSPSGLVAWLLDHCSSDWILRLDDDEVPSQALLDALPELTSDRHSACAISLKRRWLYPDQARWITDFPWGAEQQTRLLRNLPSLWTFAGTNHTEGRFLGDWAVRDLPIYHLDLLCQSQERRRAKRDWYESLAPGIEWNDFAINDMYLPEEHGSIATEAVPDADRHAIARLLSPAPVIAAHRGGSYRPDDHAVTPMREILRFNTAAEQPPDRHEGRLSFRRPREVLPARTPSWFEMVVTNLGHTTWPWGDVPPAIRIGTRWLNADGSRAPTPEQRVVFLEAIRPGIPTLVELELLTPSVPGRYLLEADIVQEGYRWFGCTARTVVTIDGGRPRAVARAALAPSTDDMPEIRARRGGLAAAVSRPLELARARRTAIGAPPGPATPVTPALGVAAADPTPPLPALLEEIYACGEVVDARGLARPCSPPAVDREEAVALAELVRHEGFAATLETGMAYGLSTIAIADVHRQRGSGRHIAIEPWHEPYGAVGMLNLERAGLRDTVQVIPALSQDALPRLVDEGCRRDFVLIDGCHLFDVAMLDFFYADRMLALDGVLALHDVAMPAVDRVLRFVLSNRNYEQIPSANANLAFLRKLAHDGREWDHFVG